MVNTVLARTQFLESENTLFIHILILQGWKDKGNEAASEVRQLLEIFYSGRETRWVLEIFHSEGRQLRDLIFEGGTPLTWREAPRARQGGAPQGRTRQTKAVPYMAATIWICAIISLSVIRICFQFQVKIVQGDHPFLAPVLVQQGNVSGQWMSGSKLWITQRRQSTAATETVFFTHLLSCAAHRVTFVISCTENFLAGTSMTGSLVERTCHDEPHFSLWCFCDAESLVQEERDLVMIGTERHRATPSSSS